MRPLPESAPSAPTARPTICPDCSEPQGPEDRYCGRCGRDLSAPVPGPGPADPGPGPDGPAAAEPRAAGRDGADGGADSGAAEAGTDLAPAPEPAGTGSFLLAPPQTASASSGSSPAASSASSSSDDTLPLGFSAHRSDPRGDDAGSGGAAGGSGTGSGGGSGSGGSGAGAPAAAGPVCVACGVGGVDDDGYCEHCGHAQPRQRDHQEKELEGVAAVSDRGLRHHRNEDAFALGTVALPDGGAAVAAVVCDGVSTAYRPDDASAAAAATGSEALFAALERGASPDDAMREALLTAFDAVSALAEEEPPEPVHRNAPACTCVSAVITGPVFTVGWIGDSRAYWVPDDRGRPAARLTEDDSWAARMVSAGLMSEAEAYADARAHAITGWLGADAVEVDPHVAAFQPEGPGVVVVCTDGLWNYAESAAEMAEAVPADARTRPLASARSLLGLALDGGGHDNVTVAVLPFPADVARAVSPSA
ncbi:putative magnesium or manganese-dependent protein phosphatase [Actinacidiphila reveromycinica]|uniref:Putative magnesium or manganese-dependent protein phosphatase n=1 Tax=Actinacidiphila reveromycinica TaxID=659352 RepID=A0A7U3VNC6_9ACTN|nr:PP2C family protein-serine/threonine phosphatase [Streptomyces sp. SN-593]BBA97479.1 putative magnesium or manganese-dependent protein phosphatase [Streptomyces sp. SN-593]